MAFRGDKIFLVSDDRGQVNEPRFYEFQIKKDKKIWKLENGQVHFVGLPPALGSRQILDQEAIATLENGHFLISSEGDNNKKPRVPPRIVEVTEAGQWIRDVPLPPRVIPEMTGQQKIGIGNNFGFEAMTLSADRNFLYFMSERPLIQDVEGKGGTSNFRFYKMRRQKDNFEFVSERLVQGPLPPEGQGIALVQGFSEMTSIDENRFLALDRTLKVFGGHQLTFECRIVELDLSGAADTSKVDKLSGTKILEAAKIIKVHSLKKGHDNLGNCEGMAMGPATDEYKQTLWIITDNNFSKSEDTVLYFYGVKN